MASKLKVLQHNVLRWTWQREFELTNLYALEGLDVILLNSHGERKKDTENIKLFNFHVYQNNPTGDQHDGAAIAVKSSISHIIINNLEEVFLPVIIHTTLGEEVCIATGCQPPRRPALPLRRILRRNIPSYFVGDVNARHAFLGHHTNNTAGNMLSDIIMERGLHIMLALTFPPLSPQELLELQTLFKQTTTVFIILTFLLAPSLPVIIFQQ